VAVSFIGGVHGENHRSAAIHGQALSCNDVSSSPRHERGSNSQPLEVICTDCTGHDGPSDNLTLKWIGIFLTLTGRYVNKG
jgi:hypothetical protein